MRIAVPVSDFTTRRPTARPHPPRHARSLSLYARVLALTGAALSPLGCTGEGRVVQTLSGTLTMRNMHGEESIVEEPADARVFESNTLTVTVDTDTTSASITYPAASHQLVEGVSEYLVPWAILEVDLRDGRVFDSTDITYSFARESSDGSMQGAVDITMNAEGAGELSFALLPED